MRPQIKAHRCPDCDRPHHTPEENKLLLAHFLTCAHCKRPLFYEYLVKKEVWSAAGMDYHGGVLHLECLEKLLDRELKLDDFEGPIGMESRHRGNSINDAIRWALRKVNNQNG